MDIKLEAYRKQCVKESGIFSSTKKRGFCEPDDPSDLFCRIECPVFGRAFCRLDSASIEEEVQLSEVNGNGNGVFDPGEEVKIAVTVKNTGRTDITSLKGTLSVDPNPAIEIKVADATLGILVLGESKTVSFSGKVPSGAPCGSKALLKFVLKGNDFLHRFSQPFVVGKLAAEPIVVSKTGVSMPLTPNGVSYAIQVDGPDAEIYKVRLFYSAEVEQPGFYRAWLTAPNLKNSWAYFADETRKHVLFNEDLTEFFSGAKVSGKWYLSGDITGLDNRAEITGYQLSVTPNLFDCK